MAQTRPGPVTMQKATFIVGKAIAKAMARETSVRESLSRSVTPEIGQDAPMVTPEPSEEEEETVGQGASSLLGRETHCGECHVFLDYASFPFHCLHVNRCVHKMSFPESSEWMVPMFKLAPYDSGIKFRKMYIYIFFLITAPITDSEDDDHLRTLDTIPEEGNACLRE